MKSRLKQKGIFDVISMSLFTRISLPDWFFVSLINSSFISLYVDNFINNTSHFQINDARQTPIKIPTELELKEFNKLFLKAYYIQKNEKLSVIDKQSLLQPVENELDLLVNQLYEI